MPLDSNALTLRYAVLRPGPELAMGQPEGLAGVAQGELLKASS